MRELSNRLNIVHAVQVRVLAGEDRGAARRADRVGGEDVASSSAPSRARRSMFGVWLTRDPYALIACAAWSSVMMKTMFGTIGGHRRRREGRKKTEGDGDRKVFRTADHRVSSLIPNPSIPNPSRQYALTSDCHPIARGARSWIVALVCGVSGRALQALVVANVSASFSDPSAGSPS